MKAVTWQGRKNVRVENVEDPKLSEPTDAIIKVTSTNICGSDLHLYGPLTPFMKPGDILGHEAMGIVEETGDEVGALAPGDRVVIPFQISCGRCFMCAHELYSQCEATQVHEHDTGPALFGYSALYGSVPGGQAEYLRVPLADFTHIRVPEGPADERFIYLSDVLPTAWQAVEYAEIPRDGTVAVLGLGPIGDMASRIALSRGHHVIGVDLVPERMERARQQGVSVIEADENTAERIKEMTGGRGTDSVIDAVGMEAHGAPVATALQTGASLLPKPVARTAMKKAGIDSLSAFNTALDAVRRGGTISLAGVYGGASDPVNMMKMFDKQVTLRMGQANVKRWTPPILELLTESDAFGVEGFATHRLSLDDAPQAYQTFHEREDGMVKVVLKP